MYLLHSHYSATRGLETTSTRKPNGAHHFDAGAPSYNSHMGMLITLVLMACSGQALARSVQQREAWAECVNEQAN